MAALLLASCESVKPPERPVAYIYPSLVPMAAIQSCTPKQLTAERIRSLLEESRSLAILESAGLQQGEIGILMRGIAKHGYAELDVRRSKCDISWLTIACHDDKTVIRVIYRKKPNDFNRFGISTKEMAESIERGYYGEFRQVASVTEGNVTLRSVKGRKSSTWEIVIVLAAN